MNVLKGLMTVLKSAPTLLDHISVAATVDTVSPVMKELAQMSTSVNWKHTTASKDATTLWEGSCVHVIKDIS